MKINENVTAADRLAHKKAVVAVYETKTFYSLLKNVLHPGGKQLTRRAFEVANIDKECAVLDIACGKGGSIFLLAKEFSCQGVGIDLSLPKIAWAAAESRKQGFGGGSSFLVSDAEVLPFEDASFDLVLLECSFSVLPEKRRAASEMARVLKPGGRLVMTDMVLENDRCDGSPSDGLTAGPTLPCIAGAVSVEEYIGIFNENGLCDPYVENHSRQLKKIAFQMALLYGGWEEFLQMLSAELRRTSHQEVNLCCMDLNGRRAVTGKSGYALIRVTKAS